MRRPYQLTIRFQRVYRVRVRFQVGNALPLIWRFDIKARNPSQAKLILKEYVYPMFRGSIGLWEYESVREHPTKGYTQDCVIQRSPDGWLKGEE